MLTGSLHHPCFCHHPANGIQSSHLFTGYFYTMPNYNVLEAFTPEGTEVEAKVGEVIGLTEEAAAPLLESGKVSLVVEGAEGGEAAAS